MSTNCACGGKYSGITNFMNHMKTKKHITYLESGIVFHYKYNPKDLDSKRKYFQNYYENHKDIWLNCPSQLAKKNKITLSVNKIHHNDIPILIE